MAYEIEEARALVLKAAKELVDHKLIARTWGNISARISPTQFVITPSGRDYDSLKPEDLVTVDLNGKYEEGKTPSSEKGVHAQCYKLRPDVNFVIHTHQPFASALSVLGHDIKLGPRISDKTKGLIGPRVVCAEYGRNASKKLANAVGTVIENNLNCSHVLMKYHGALCFGPDYDYAFRVTYTLEELSKKIFEYYTKEPVKTSPDEIYAVQTIPDDLLDETGKSTEKVGEWILHAKTPYIQTISESGQPMKAYLDDIAQIAGIAIKCSPENADSHKIGQARGGNMAVFAENDGAFCYGSSYDEAHAVAQVLEKACMAAYLAGFREAQPLNTADALHDRLVYVKKYSKLKDK